MSLFNLDQSESSFNSVVLHAISSNIDTNDIFHTKTKQIIQDWNNNTSEKEHNLVVELQKLNGYLHLDLLLASIYISDNLLEKILCDVIHKTIKTMTLNEAREWMYEMKLHTDDVGRDSKSENDTELQIHSIEQLSSHPFLDDVNAQKYFIKNVIVGTILPAFIMLQPYTNIKSNVFLIDFDLNVSSLGIVYKYKTDANTACEIGSLALVKIFSKHSKFLFDERVMVRACRMGRLDIVDFLHFNRKEVCTTDAMDYAAFNGHVSVLEFLHTNRSEGCTDEAITGAACNGHLDVVKWLHENWKYTGKEPLAALEAAADMGHLEIVKFLYENRTDGNVNNAIHNATTEKYVDIVELLRA